MLPTFADVQSAAARLAGHAHVTPVVTSRSLDEACGARAFLKCENLQRVGAFKFRGAWNAISRLSPRSAEIFSLRYFEGMSYQEIAETTGNSSGLVAVLLHRTRARLKKELAGFETLAGGLS